MKLLIDDSFELVYTINEMVGNKVNSDYEKLEKQATLLIHEVEELIKGIKDKDTHEIRDGLADIAFVLAGFDFMSGQNLTRDLPEVIRSNISKFDLNEDDAIKTKESYLQRGLKTRYEKRIVPPWVDVSIFNKSEYYVTYVDGEQLFNNQMVPDGKWLKSIHFKEPQFKE